MAKKKRYEPTNPNKRKTKKPERKIVCPNCGSENMVYTPDRRRVPSKWYIHAGAATVVIIFAFAMPWFALAFGIGYVALTFRKHKVLVGTCQDCGTETLFNRPEDGSLTPDFDKPWTS